MGDHTCKRCREWEPLVKAALRLGKCAAEFDGQMEYCGEYDQALWTEIHKLEALEKQLCEHRNYPGLCRECFDARKEKQTE